MSQFEINIRFSLSSAFLQSQRCFESTYKIALALTSNYYIGHIIFDMQISSDSSSSSSHNQAQFRRIYQRQLQKEQAAMKKNADQGRIKLDSNQVKLQNHRKRRTSFHDGDSPQSHSRSRSRDRRRRRRERSSSAEAQEAVYPSPVEIKWFIYQKCPPIELKGRVSRMILELPIFKKKQQILNAIIRNQFVLVTGETGCGKSTQVPRLIYEYLKETNNLSAKIMCVQPRRLAVVNLQSILNKQMQADRLIGYQIGMQSHIHPDNRIVFVTNGIFLQRLVHSTEFFNEYPFIILDEVHERDIDTDFILLTVKRVIREHPRVRVVLMSATIDNDLFRYYFASDHIDNILSQENIYKKILLAQQKAKRQDKMVAEQEQDDEVDVESENEEALYKTYGLQFLKSQDPCPAINVTEPGKYTRQYYYLDTVGKFLPTGTLNLRWGSIIFSDKYPSTHKELHETVFLIIDQIASIHKRDTKKCSVLIFVPGLGDIEGLSQSLYRFFRTQRVNREFQIIHVHSTILTEDITRKLHEPEGKKIKIIISTNIAESSITVLGVRYVIDFCLSKQVRFDVKSRMENLELVWASKASCNQRAGRTGRVCDGVIFRLLEESFYQKLADYSTPEIQRSSLDKLILRIKLLHEGHHNQIFADPGEVLGSAIQPPNLKNIDTAIKSLQFCGGLQLKDDEFHLTDLGRIYIDIPIDITYCKLLVISQLFGTFQDVLILVSILSQSKNAIRKGNIDKNYQQFYQLMDNKETCDFLALVQLYKDTQLRYSTPQNEKFLKGKGISNLGLETYREVRDMIYDIRKRLKKKGVIEGITSQQREQENGYNDLVHKVFHRNRDQQYLFRFKLTILCGFIENVLKVREPTYDEKQEKRLKFMKKEGIRSKNTVCLLGSNVIRKPQTQQAEEKLKAVWKSHVERAIMVKGTDFTITHGLSYLHFDNEKDLNKFLFYRYIEENKKNYSDIQPTKSEKNFLTATEIFRCFGEMDHMHLGRPVTFCKEQTVTIDNYSLNRVINVNEGDQQKYLIANNIAKQSSRMVARYTSLLPHNILYLEIIGHLLFYPFIHLVPNRRHTRYEFIQLKKKHRIPLSYNLVDEEIKKANVIRRKLRNHLSLNKSVEQTYDDFKYLILQYAFLKRQQIIEEERWQESYLKQAFQKNEELKNAYIHTLQSQQPKVDYQPQGKRSSQKIFMNQIKHIGLTLNYFSDIVIGDTTIEWRKRDYNNWKLEKLREINEIQQKALNHDSYLACGQNSCGLKLAKLKKVGPINQEIYRDLFETEQDNIVAMQFSDMGSHFCTMLMGSYIDSEYKIYGCAKQHYFGIRLEREKRIKILPFSQLILIYPDGSAEKADFERLDIKYWKRRHDERLQEKLKMRLATYCFVCDELLSSFKDLQYHIKEGRHAKNVKEFKRTLPQQAKQKPIAAQNNQQEGY